MPKPLRPDAADRPCEVLFEGCVPNDTHRRSAQDHPDNRRSRTRRPRGIPVVSGRSLASSVPPSRAPLARRACGWGRAVARRPMPSLSIWRSRSGGADAATSRAVPAGRRAASRAGLVEVVLDRYTEAGEGPRLDGAARRIELEVEQRIGDAITEDDVLRAHVVVAHERPARRVSQTVVPAETIGVEPPAASPSRAAAWRWTPARCRTGSSPDRAPRGPRRR